MSHFSAKRARGSSGTARAPTTSANVQLEPLPSEAQPQVSNTDRDVSNSEPSASSGIVNSPEYNCPTPSINYYSSDEEPGSLKAEFSGDSDDSSQRSIIIVTDPTPGPSTVNIPPAAVSVSSTVVAKPDTLPDSSTNTSTPNDISQSAVFPPVHPVNVKFPATKFGTKTRTFNVAWYDKSRWLEYSVQRDACFCYPCHIFGTSTYGRSRPEHAFTTTGFRNWKKATGKDGVLNVMQTAFLISKLKLHGINTSAI